ncbi:hypothetical protein [Pseudomonas sichuanensis]|nr:hypothetical protein [Pseudomonas sichuanensis]UVL87224.1 hypothetical protein LOY51_15615 [Pseudomonas sichuanensis]
MRTKNSNNVMKCSNSNRKISSLTKAVLLDAKIKASHEIKGISPFIKNT